MDMPEAQAWTFLAIGAGTAIVSIITALKVGSVHRLVNSAMSEERAENALLRSMIVAKNLEASTAESTRLALAGAVSHQTDLAEASKRIRAGMHSPVPPTTPPVPPTSPVPPVPPPTPLPVILTDSRGQPIPTPLEVSVRDTEGKQ